MQLTPGTKFGPYVVVRPLRETDDHTFTLIRHPRGLLELKTWNGDRHPDRNQLDAVAQVLRRIEHDMINETRAVVDLEGRPGIAYDYVDATTLKAVLERDTGLDDEKAASLFQHMVEGLEAAHQVGVSHGKLSAETVMLVPVGTGWRAHLTAFEGSQHDPAQARRADVVALAALAKAMFGGTLPMRWERAVEGALEGQYDHASTFALALWPDQERPAPPVLGPEVGDEALDDGAREEPEQPNRTLRLVAMAILVPCITMPVAMGANQAIELGEAAERYRAAIVIVDGSQEDYAELVEEAQKLGVDVNRSTSLLRAFQAAPHEVHASELLSYIDDALRSPTGDSDPERTHRRSALLGEIGEQLVPVERASRARGDHLRLSKTFWGRQVLGLGIAPTLH